MADILIIDDDTDVNYALSNVIKAQGHSVISAFTIREGLDCLYSCSIDVVFMDIRLPDGNGLQALPQIHNSSSFPEVIIMTAYDSESSAEIALKNGAWDYIKKPATMDNVILCMKRALQYRGEKIRQVPVILKREKIIGSSRKINDVLERIAQVSPSNTNVLLTGETGTGKELFARNIHENSSRSKMNFVVVDCASIPEQLVENILFGHDKGAFTGADRSKEGLIAQADNGTLFLDEVGELPLVAQKSFLRVLQERRYIPLGGEKELTCDFRLIAATNKHLDDMVAEGTFRNDFLFRINSFPIELPSLRERGNDILELFFHYSNWYCETYGIETKGFAPEFLEALTGYEWPGNVRELFNTLDQVFAVARNEPTFFPYHLPVALRVKLSSSGETLSVNKPDTPSENGILQGVKSESYPTFREFKETMERTYLKNLLSETNGKKNQACNISGLSRSQFFSLLKKYDI